MGFARILLLENAIRQIDESIDFDPPDGPTVRSKPFLEANNFNAAGTIIAEGSPAAGDTASR